MTKRHTAEPELGQKDRRTAIYLQEMLCDSIGHTKSLSSVALQSNSGHTRKYLKTCHQIHSLHAFFNKYLLQKKTNICKPTSCVLLARVTRSSILLQGYAHSLRFVCCSRRARMRAKDPNIRNELSILCA